jgi:hypothetical protein
MEVTSIKTEYTIFCGECENYCSECVRLTTTSISVAVPVDYLKTRRYLEYLGSNTAAAT